MLSKKLKNLINEIGRFIFMIIFEVRDKMRDISYNVKAKYKLSGL